MHIKLYYLNFKKEDNKNLKKKFWKIKLILKYIINFIFHDVMKIFKCKCFIIFKHKLNSKSFSSNKLTEFNMREVIAIHVGQGGI